MKLKKEMLFFVFLCSITTLLYVVDDLNSNILFIFNLILCSLICIKSKFSMFSLKSLLINYVMISVAFQYNTGESYGILEISHYTINYFMMNILVAIYNSILYMYIVNSKALEYEQAKFKEKIYMSNLATLFCSVLAIVCAIIAFPSLNFNFSQNEVRFNSLLPGNAWNHITIVSLIVIYPNLRKSKIAKVAYGFCIIWFLLHSERVDMVGLLIAMIIIASTDSETTIKIKDNIKKHKNLFKYIIAIFVVIISMVLIGEIRAGKKNFSIEETYRKILIQNTAADIGYVFNVSIKDVKQNGYMYGSTYKTYIEKIIPFISASNDASNYLRDRYNTPGGILILCEPYMNFGIIGLILFEILELYCINFILKKKTKYSIYLYVFLLATTFRTTWYGLVYIEKAVVYFMPILYTVCNVLNNGRKVND